MNELEQYHDRVLGQEVVNLQIPPGSEGASASHLVAGPSCGRLARYRVGGREDFRGQTTRRGADALVGRWQA